MTAQTLAAGIDGGGTGTTVECRSADGAVLCRERFGPFNLNSIGEARFTALWGEITAFLAQRGTCAALCAGAAGASNPRVRTLTAQAMERAGIPRWRLAGDHEIALYGALSGRPGCVLIAGTGSICCGRNAQGRSARAGGWGHLIDDGGSGYALGRDALAAVVRQWDGRGSATLLAALISAQVGAETPGDLAAWAHGGDKSRIASLAPLVEQAAGMDDAAALDICRRGGAELALLAVAVAGRLGMETGELALLGGALGAGTHLRAALEAALARDAPGLRCVPPQHDAAAGAAMLALELLREA